MNKELKRCPLCGALPKLVAYREGVWVDIGCSDEKCAGNKFACTSINEAIRTWNNYALHVYASAMYELIKQMALPDGKNCWQLEQDARRLMYKIEGLPND